MAEVKMDPRAYRGCEWNSTGSFRIARCVLHLVLATRNSHKTREFADILGPGFRVTDLRGSSDVPSVEETGTTFEENAVLKAVTASRALATLVVADDSGLEVEALDDAPGIRSARYAGQGATDQDNIAKLLRDLRGARDRGAHFSCVIAMACRGEVKGIFQGRVSGSIALRPQGNEGFGYDPLFIPTGFTQSFGELGAEQKNQISHRAVAIARFRFYLARRGG